MQEVHIDMEAARFNRTFMELKVGKDYKDTLSTVSQSHLYGIERQFLALRTLTLCVSIAPLWN